jgi:hypothetical protein
MIIRHNFGGLYSYIDLSHYVSYAFQFGNPCILWTTDAKGRTEPHELSQEIHDVPFSSVSGDLETKFNFLEGKFFKALEENLGAFDFNIGVQKYQK